jgi:hypothetical protein
MKYGKEMQEAQTRMAIGFGEFAKGLADVVGIAMREAVEAITRIDWSELTKLKEADPDMFNWTASGPIRRYQLRRARALMSYSRRA